MTAVSRRLSCRRSGSDAPSAIAATRNAHHGLCRSGQAAPLIPGICEPVPTLVATGALGGANTALSAVSSRQTALTEALAEYVDAGSGVDVAKLILDAPCRTIAKGYGRPASYSRKALEPEDHKISVLVADDEDRLRRIVTALLSVEDGIEVVGQAVDGQDAIAQAQALVPDLVLLDVRMPGINGIEAAQAINRLLPTTKVVMLTASEEEEDVFEALKAGASGYLLKETLLEDLPGAIRVVAQGLGLLLSPSIASKLVTEFKEAGRPGSATGANSLTVRELEVLRLVSLGRANHEIAEELCLSSHTVKRHVANILAKLHQRSRLDAVMHAIRNGVLAETP